MSSLTENEFDAGLDRLLRESVSEGAEPAGLAIVIAPRRPKFNWRFFGRAVAVFAMATVVLLSGIIAQPGPADPLVENPRSYLWCLLTDGVILATEYLSSATFLMYAAVLMASVYALLARRIIGLYRFR